MFALLDVGTLGPACFRRGVRAEIAVLPMWFEAPFAVEGQGSRASSFLLPCAISQE